MLRKLNFTERAKIPRSHVRVSLRRGDDGILVFDPQLSFDGVGVVATARVFIEAYYRTSFMRFDCGSVEAFAKGARVVFTPKEDFPSVGKSRTMQRLLAKCFMCFVNERELDRLTGATGVSGISILHSLGVSIVVATFGAQGAVIATPQVSWKVAPSAISKAKDVVGAGDCFAAGMLAALSRDVDLRRASAFAGELTAWWLANRIEREPEVLQRFASELTRFRSN